MSENTTTVAIRRDVKEELERLREEWGGTTSEVITKLLQVYRMQKEAEAIMKVMDIPHDVTLEEDVIQAIEEAQPPPEWRLLLIYLLVGLLGGAGIGLFLALR